MFKAEMKFNVNKALLLPLLMVLAAVLVSPAFASQNRHENREHGFSFNYPEAWIEMPPIGSASAVGASPVSNFATNFNVVITEPQGASALTERDISDFFRSIFTNWELRSFRRGSLLGEDVAIIDHRFSQGEFELRLRQYLVDHGRRGYTLTFTALESRFHYYEDDFAVIVNSFRF